MKKICESPVGQREENDIDVSEIVKAYIAQHPELKRLYQKEVLLESAERLLKNTQLSVREIAENLRLPVETVQNLKHSMTIRTIAYVEEHEEEIRAKAEELMKKHEENILLSVAVTMLEEFSFSVPEIAHFTNLPVEKIERLKQTIESS